MAKLANLTAAVSLALAAPIVAQGALLFDPDGAAGPLGTYEINRFDWSPTSVLADNGNRAISNFVANGFSSTGPNDTTFWVYSMAKLSTGQLGLINQFSLDGSGLSNDEITIMVGFQEQVVGLTPDQTVAQFAQINKASSFIKMYYDDGSGIQSNALTGDGFGDGTLIFDSHADVTGDDTGRYVTTFTSVSDLDQFEDDDWAGQQTTTGFGNNNSVAFSITSPDLISIDGNFFKNLPLTSFLTTNLSFNSPFTTTDPAKGYSSDGVGSPDLTVGNGGVDIGIVNGAPFGNGGGSDFLFSSDFNSSVNGTTIPEPISLALFGAGLGLLGSTSLRRCKKA